MKQNINIACLFILITSLGISGCKKQLDINPRQSIIAETALDTREEITASIVGIYSLLKSPRLYGRDLIALPEALADNGFANNRSGRLLNESRNVLPVATNGANHFTGTLWTNSYAAINQINLTLAAIAGLQVVPVLTAAEKADWEGQLFFLRGLYYFELVRAYAYIPGAVVVSQNQGGVPVTPSGVTTIAAANAYKPERQPIDSVYTYIVNDLLRAELSLVDQPAIKNTATKAGARSMLSRVYLYSKNYPESKRWSDSAIRTFTPAKLTDQTDYVTNWRVADNKETIFQIRFALNNENIGVNESLQTSFTSILSPGITTILGGFGDLVPTITLLTDLGITLTTGTDPLSFISTNASITSRNSDVRNFLYEVGSTGRGKSYVEATKYLGKNGFPNLDNVPVIRLSEMYLNRAEAQATPGSSVFNMANAILDLKFIKSRRYVGYTGSPLETADDALTGQLLINEILRQERIEFAFEGHRFFDLKRMALPILKSQPITSGTLQPSDPRILPPIPQGDVDGNPNLRQNFGY